MVVRLEPPDQPLRVDTPNGRIASGPYSSVLSAPHLTRRHLPSRKSLAGVASNRAGMPPSPLGVGSVVAACAPALEKGEAECLSFAQVLPSLSCLFLWHHASSGARWRALLMRPQHKQRAGRGISRRCPPLKDWHYVGRPARAPYRALPPAMALRLASQSSIVDRLRA
jgi:hypothetical protein